MHHLSPKKKAILILQPAFIRSHNNIKVILEPNCVNSQELNNNYRIYTRVYEELVRFGFSLLSRLEKLWQFSPWIDSQSQKRSTFPHFDFENFGQRDYNNFDHFLQVCQNNPRVYCGAWQFLLELPPEWILLLMPHNIYVHISWQHCPPNPTTITNLLLKLFLCSSLSSIGPSIIQHFLSLLW
jgi:hypothetical protein